MNRLQTTTAGTISGGEITSVNWALQWGDATTPGYDEFGNRLTQTKVPGSPGTPPEITLAYNEATNRITTGGYSYDYNGNLTAMPGISGIQWDVFDRMTQATANGATTQYGYDAFGRRVLASQSGETPRVYFYDTGGRLLSASNPDKRSYTMA